MDQRRERSSVNRRGFVKGGSAALGATVFGMPWQALAQGVLSARGPSYGVPQMVL